MVTGQPEFDLLTMGRAPIDLYTNDAGAPFTEIKSFAAHVGGRRQTSPWAHNRSKPGDAETR